MGNGDLSRRYAELKAMSGQELSARMKKALVKLYGKPRAFQCKASELAYTVIALEHNLEVIRYFQGIQVEAKAS